jgi:hypothetical protein
MLSRRDVFTGGVLGSLSSAGVSGAEQQSPESQALAAGFKELGNNLGSIRGVLDQGLVGPSLSGGGFIGKIRDMYRIHLKQTGHFPEFMEIGIAPFYELYDWHVRNAQQIQIIRVAENRMAIQFMFTQCILRWEQDERYLGQPYDSR